MKLILAFHYFPFCHLETLILNYHLTLDLVFLFELVKQFNEFCEKRGFAIFLI